MRLSKSNRLSAVLTGAICASLLLSGCSLNSKGREMDELLNLLELEDLFGEPSHRESKVYQFSPEGYTVLSFANGEPDDYLLAIARSESIGGVCSRYPSTLGDDLPTFTCEHGQLTVVIYGEKSVEALIDQTGGLPGFGNVDESDDLSESTLVIRVR